jgi:hypothetical protein
VQWFRENLIGFVLSQRSYGDLLSIVIGHRGGGFAGKLIVAGGTPALLRVQFAVS